MKNQGIKYTEMSNEFWDDFGKTSYQTQSQREHLDMWEEQIIYFYKNDETEQYVEGECNNCSSPTNKSYCCLNCWCSNNI